MPSALKLFVVCAVMAASAELIAARFALWVYPSAWRRAATALLSGMLITGVSLGAQHLPVAGQFGAGAAFGVVYELLNLRVLKLWTFPDDRLWGLKGERALVLGVGLAWGVVPVTALRILAL